MGVSTDNLIPSVAWSFQSTILCSQRCTVLFVVIEHMLPEILKTYSDPELHYVRSSFVYVERDLLLVASLLGSTFNYSITSHIDSVTWNRMIY